MTHKYYYTFAFLLLISTFSFSQGLTEHYFADNQPKVQGRILGFSKTPNMMVLRGQSANQFPFPTEYIGGIGPLGQVAWYSYDWPSDTTQATGYSNIVTGKDGFLYVVQTQGSNHSLLKVNLLSGIVQWKKLLPMVYEPTRMVERVPGELVTLDFMPNGGILHRYSTADGAELGAYPLSGGSVTSLAADANGDLYYYKSDSLYKANGTNPAQTIWKTWFRVPLSGSSITNFTGYELSPDGQHMLFYGSSDGGYGIYAHVQLNTGEVTQISQTYTEESFRDKVVRGDTVYTCWQHRYVGGGTFRFSLHAARLSDGALVYQQFYNINYPGSPNPLYGTAGSLSLDMDQHGFLYLTGYGNSANYDPGAWGVVKVRASDGQKIWDKVLDETPGPFDNYSTGRVVWCPSGTKLFVGGEMEAQYTQNIVTSGYEPVTFFELDTATGAPTSRFNVSGYYQQASAGLQFLNLDQDVVALKKLDNCAALVRYDEAGMPLWEKSYCDLKWIEPSGIYPGKNQTIYLTTTTKYAIQGGSYIDSMYLLKINALNGSVLNKWGVKVDVGSGYSYPLHVSAATDTVLFFYHDYDRRKYARIINDQMETPILLQTSIYDAPPLKAPQEQFIQRGRETVYRYSLNQYYRITPTEAAGMSYPTPPMEVLAIAAVPNSTDILAVGGPNNGWGWGIFRYTLGQPSFVWKQNGSFGAATRLAVGSHDEFYTYGVFSGDLYVKKFTISTGALQWEKTIEPPGADAELYDLQVDETSGGVLLVGALKYPVNQRNAWLLKLDANGNVVFNIEKQGNTPGPFNRALSLGRTASGNTLIGGQLQRTGLGKAGFIWGLTDQVYAASGNVFIDQNDNGIFDPAESVWRQTVSIQPGNYLSFPDLAGSYSFFALNNDTYEALVQTPSPWYEIIPAVFALNGSQSNIHNAHIRIRPLSAKTDMSIMGAEITPPRFGALTSILVTVTNLGTLPTDSAYLHLDCGANFSLQNLRILNGADTIPDQEITGHVLDALLDGVQPLAIQQYIAQGQLNSFVAPGDSLQCVLELGVYPSQDAQTANNRDTLKMVVTGAYDPNDLTAYPSGQVPLSELQADGSLPLTYRVRFENTGNAPTDFVRIEANIDPLNQPASFKLLASSAPCVVRFLENNRVEFLLSDYHLLPAGVDSSLAQGFVLFAVQSKPNLQKGDQLNSQAAIYFDFNPPIVTNEVETEIVETVSIAEPDIANERRVWYPNPVAVGHRVRLSGALDPTEVATLLDVFGRVVRRVPIGEGIDTRGLAPGVYQIRCKKANELLILK